MMEPKMKVGIVSKKEDVEVAGRENKLRETLLGANFPRLRELPGDKAMGCLVSYQSSGCITVFTGVTGFGAGRCLWNGPARYQGF